MSRKGTVFVLAAALMCTGLLLAHTTQDAAKSARQGQASAAAKLPPSSGVPIVIPRTASLPVVGEKPKTEGGDFPNLSDEQLAKQAEMAALEANPPLPLSVAPFDPGLVGTGEQGAVTREGEAACVGDVTIGTGSGTSSSYPMSSYWYYTRSMSLIKRSEYTTCAPYKITQLAIEITTAQTNAALTNIELRMKKTSATSTGTTWDGTGDLVYSAASMSMTPVGWKVIVLTTPFIWDTGNLLITWQAQGPSTTGYPYYRYSSPGFPTGEYPQAYSNSDSAFQTTLTSVQNYRVLYTLTFEAPPAIGACCTGYTCVAGMTEADCLTASGIYRGDGSVCTPNPCQAACCYPPAPTCADNSPEECAALGGVWHLGESCGTFFCPPWNDSCSAVTPVTLTPGTPETFSGDNRGATNDCASFPGGQVWHAFTLPSTSSFFDVWLDYCSTTPAFMNGWLNLGLGCPCTSYSTAATWETTSCGDGNMKLSWKGLAAGTYYYPVMLSTDPNALAAGPYTLHVDCVPAYCAAAANSYAYEYIQRVQVGTIDNTTTGSAYSDFTALSTQMIIGSSHAITVTNAHGYSDDLCGVWIDWNQDYDFSESEKVTMAGSPGVGPYTGTITAPLSALTGSTRMRIRIYEGTTISPCGTGGYGEVEDYTIDVKEPPPLGACCTGLDCTILDEETCLATPGNVYKGNGSTCSPNMCAGACCFFDGSCNDVHNETTCLAAGGAYQGDGTTCAGVTCPLPGACCFPDAHCEYILEADCPGIWQGAGVLCESVTCPIIITPGETCATVYVIPAAPFAAQYDTDLATADGPSCNTSYTVMQNDVWLSYTPTADCMLTVNVSDVGSGYDMVMAVYSGPDCNTLTQLYCLDDPEPYTVEFVATAGTTYWFQQGDYGSTEGGGLTNFSLACSSATGACCFGDGHCEVLTAVACLAASGTFQGDATVCDPNPCRQPVPGDSCDLPISVNLPVDMPYTDAAQYTCGRPGVDPNTCLGYYDSGPYVMYKLYVTETTCVTITATGADPNNNYIGIAVDYACPPASTCIAAAGSSSSTSVSISNLVLPAGTYTLMVSNWAPGPDCLYNYTLTIAAGTCPFGACCLAGQGTLGCQTMFQVDCTAAGGSFAGANTVCSGNDCDANGTDDLCDILGGVADCNANGIPDACEIAANPNLDADQNGILDSCQPDCNANGIPDTCELPGGCATGNCGTVYPEACGLQLDCQPDGIPDICQLTKKVRACNEMVYDAGVCDGVNGTRPTVGWNDTGLVDKFTVPQAGGPTQFSCFHMEILDSTQSDMTTLRLRIYALPTGSIPTDLPSFAAATPVFDHQYTVAGGELVITPRAECYPGVGAWDYDATGPSFDLGTGSYALLVNFPGFGAVNYWASAADDGLGYAFVWGAQVDAPSDAEMALAWRLTGGGGGTGGGDCNLNGIPDDCDIRDNPTWDCDVNGVIDTCEWVDCNGNGILDACDIISGTSTDCNNNGIPDECDISSGTSLDCNYNGVPDECDISTGHSEDCNANGIPDECDIMNCPAGELWCQDCNFDDIPDGCELGRVKDVAISEGFEGTVPPATWTAVVTISTATWKVGTGSPPEGTQFADCEYDDQLRQQDEWIITPALNMSGTVTLSGQTMGSTYWSTPPHDNYSVQAWVVIGANVNDGDDILIGNIEDNWVTTWVWTSFSMQFAAPSTSFRIGFRYYGLDGAQAGLDAILVEGSLGPPANDCNLNGIPDECDISSGYSHDYNHNGTPDECEPMCGDFNGDAQVNATDYYLLRDAFGRCTGDPLYLAAADMDGDGCVTLIDYQQWLVCYHMVNGKVFVVPVKKPYRVQTPAALQPAQLER